MSSTRVVEVKKNKVKVKSKDDWMEFVRRLGNEIGSQSARGEEDGICEAACASHNGVEACGHTFVICGDGEVFLLDP